MYGIDVQIIRHIEMCIDHDIDVDIDIGVLDLPTRSSCLGPCASGSRGSVVCLAAFDAFACPHCNSPIRSGNPCVK